MRRRDEAYKNARIQGSYDTLPAGNYVCVVKGLKERKNDKGEKSLDIFIDIAEGEKAGFYEKDYKNNKNEDKKWRGTYWMPVIDDDSDWVRNGSNQWADDKLKTFCAALEDSNSGYHWDWNEDRWKGLIFGGQFREEEYEKNNGEVGSVVRIGGICTAEAIRNGEAKVLKAKLLKVESRPDSDGFIGVPAEEEDLPF